MTFGAGEVADPPPGRNGTVGPGGFEPPLTDPKSAVLPLDEGPVKCLAGAGLKPSGQLAGAKGGLAFDEVEPETSGGLTSTSDPRHLHIWLNDHRWIRHFQKDRRPPGAGARPPVSVESRGAEPGAVSGPGRCQAPGFLWLADTEGRFIYANRPWERFTGSSLEQLNRLGWERFNHPDEVAEVRERWGRAAERGGQFEMELRYRRHDGEYRWMLARVVPLRDGTGSCRDGWAARSISMISRRPRTRSRQRERELNDFFENAAVAIHWVGPDGTILRANQAELDLLGYDRDEYVGRNIVELPRGPHRSSTTFSAG